MKAAILCVLCVGVVLGVPPSNEECTLVSRDDGGNPAYCGGFANAQCPNPTTDTCTYYQGADYGPCCIGCQSGDPLPGLQCGGWGGIRCPGGYRCVYDPFIADAPGMCCLIGQPQGYLRRGG